MEPVGLDFRLRACETTLRDHTNELAAQKILLQQLVEAVKEDAASRPKLEERLNVSFTESNKRHDEHSKNGDRNNQRLEVTTQRIEMVTHTVNALTAAVTQKLDMIAQEIAHWKTEASRAHAERASPTPQREAPPTPQSWGGTGSGMPAREESSNMGPPVMEAGHSGAHGTTTNVPTLFGNPQAPNHDGQQSSSQYPNHNSGPTFHNLSPPNEQWSPLSGQPDPQRNAWNNTTANSQFGQWAPGAGTENRPFVEKDWSVEGKKMTKELKAFDGGMQHYDNWRRRVRDHFISVNCNYSKIFSVVESQKTPISWSVLSNTRNRDLPYLNWHWIATHIWTIIGGFLNDTQLNRRTDLTLGEEFNGLELWRALYTENCGGSAELLTTERGFFIDFPKCHKATDLRAHLGQWMQLRQKYGGGLPQDHLILMFQKILPDDVLANLKLQRDMKDDLQRQLSHVFSELGTFTDSHLSKWNLSKLQHALKPAKPGAPTPLNVVSAEQQSFQPPEESSQGPQAPPPVPDMATFQANIERMVNAAFTRSENRGRDTRRQTDKKPPSRDSSSGSQRSFRRTPNPRFEGCWCCGSKDHSRADCPEFKEIKKKNGGKVPRDYMGAYEKSMKKTAAAKSKPVSAVSVKARHDELEETVPIWPIMQIPKPTATSNIFSDLQSDEEDADESEVMKALSQLTGNVQMLSHKSLSQKQKKAKGGHVLNIAHLNSIARDVKSGKISLPDVDLERDEEYTYVWALVDSGAGANVARKSQFPHSYPVEAPKIALTTANGSDLPVRGARAVTTQGKNGVSTTRRFYDANVEMPILSVAELSDEGPLGSDVRFRRTDGYIEDKESGMREYFVKRRGVYFTKLYVRRVNDKNTGFARPGP